MTDSQRAGQAYLRRGARFFVNPLVYSGDGDSPAIMTMSRALAE